MEKQSDIIDAGKIILRCANCNKPLMELWIVRPKENIKTKVRATCPYCGDKSYIKEIHGGFARGVIGKQTDDEFADLIVTNIADVEKTNDDVYLFKIIKEKQ